MFDVDNEVRHRFLLRSVLATKIRVDRGLETITDADVLQEDILAQILQLGS